jgi:hypothetical protein
VTSVKPACNNSSATVGPVNDPTTTAIRSWPAGRKRVGEVCGVAAAGESDASIPIQVFPFS